MAPSHSSGSSSASEDDPADQTWDDWTEAPPTAHSLFDDETFAGAEEALKHDKAVHGVDLALLCSTLDFFERIRLINWIRSTKAKPESLKRLDRSASWLQDDRYLKPVIEDDALLQVDFDTLSLSSLSLAPAFTSSGEPVPSSSTQHFEKDDLIQSLRLQLSDSSQALDQLKKLYSAGGRSRELEEATKSGGDEIEGAQRSEGKEEERDDDTHYFESYQYNDIHEIMLKDRVRTDSYRDFILNNPQIFKGKVVLDVGCGTGILSMFAAKSGARKVYAVDASKVAFKAERNIKANGFSDVITVINGKVEDVVIPEKVDVIVSEWMGYFLLYECMLDSVLLARDRYMAPGGLMVPSQTSIVLSLFEASTVKRDRMEFWSNVYDFKMDAMREGMEDEAMIDVVHNEEVVGEGVVLSPIVTQTCTVPDLSFHVPFTLLSNRKTTVRAFLGHFDTFFTTDGRPVQSEKDLGETEVFFTTGAHGTPTHWKQTVFLLKDSFEVEDGTRVEGMFKCSKNPDNSRELVVEVVYSVGNGEKKAQVWKVR